MNATWIIYIGAIRCRELRPWYFRRDWGWLMKNFVGLTIHPFRILRRGGNPLLSLTTSRFYLSKVKSLLNGKVVLVKRDTLGFFTQLHNNKYIFLLVNIHHPSFDLVFHYVGSPVKYLFRILCYDYNRRIDITWRFRSYCYPKSLR